MNHIFITIIIVPLIDSALFLVGESSQGPLFGCITGSTPIMAQMGPIPLISVTFFFFFYGIYRIAGLKKHFFMGFLQVHES